MRGGAERPDPGAVRARAEAADAAGSPAAALAVMTAAAEDLRDDRPLEAATLLAEASWYARTAYGPRRALEVAQEAAVLAGDAGGGVALVVHGRLGDALQWNGRYAEAREEWRRAAAAPAGSDPNLLCTRTDALLRAGDLTAARESAYAAAARASGAEHTGALRDALAFAAHAEIHLGLLREARATAHRLEAAAERGTADQLYALGLLAWVEAIAGDELACESRIEAAGVLAGELGVTLSSGMASGLLALANGRYEDATRHLTTKLDGDSPVAAALSMRPYLDALVEANARSGRMRKAEELVAEAFAPSLETSQARYVAIGFRMRAVVTGAIEDFGSALESHAEWGNRFEEGRTRLLLGEALRRAKRRREARTELAAAAAAFAAVGARVWERRAQNELRAAGGGASEPSSRAVLTAQENRVAALVAEGLSNKEIAARLVVSTKTVEGHLRNVFEKLGVTSRTHVVRAMIR